MRRKRMSLSDISPEPAGVGHLSKSGGFLKMAGIINMPQLSVDETVLVIFKIVSDKGCEEQLMLIEELETVYVASLCMQQPGTNNSATFSAILARITSRGLETEANVEEDKIPELSRRQLGHILSEKMKEIGNISPAAEVPFLVSLMKSLSVPCQEILLLTLNANIMVDIVRRTLSEEREVQPDPVASGSN